MKLFVAFLGVAVFGFLLGAVVSFIVSRRFLKKRSRELYERWYRREQAKQKNWKNKLVHDLKNPLFLIQAFTWNYLDKLKNHELPPSTKKKSSKKMAEVLNRQADKALKILKDSTKKN